MIKTIDVNCKEWRDKVNGNNYFSGNVIIDYGLPTVQGFKIPFQCGYEMHYIDVAKDMLTANNIINPNPMHALWRYCKDNNVILRTTLQVNCKKKEVKND